MTVARPQARSEPRLHQKVGTLPAGSQGRCVRDAQGDLPGPWGHMALCGSDSRKEQASPGPGEEKSH